MNEILVLPAGPLADASLTIARASESQAILDHSIRSFLFARLLADHEGCLNDADYDEDLLFAATVLHALVLGENATSTEFGRRSLCTRLSASLTGAVCSPPSRTRGSSSTPAGSPTS